MLKNDCLNVYICSNFDKGISKMKVTLEFDLTLPSERYAYEASKRGLEACQMLESLKACVQGYQAYKGISESVLADLIADLDKWEDVKI